jgi:hypothetical protein
VQEYRGTKRKASDAPDPTDISDDEVDNPKSSRRELWTPRQSRKVICPPGMKRNEPASWPKDLSRHYCMLDACCSSEQPFQACYIAEVSMGALSCATFTCNVHVLRALGFSTDSVHATHGLWGYRLHWTVHADCEVWCEVHCGVQGLFPALTATSPRLKVRRGPFRSCRRPGPFQQNQLQSLGFPSRAVPLVDDRHCHPTPARAALGWRLRCPRLRHG